MLKGMGKKLQHANTKYRFDHFPLLVALPMESPTLVQKLYAWDRDSMMRALHCDYGKRADFLRDVEDALGEREEKEEWDKLVNDNPCPDDKWSCLNDIIGRIAKKHFGRKAHETGHTEIGKLVQELKVDRGRRAQLRLLMELLPSGCTTEVNRTAANLLHVASSDRTKTLGEQLEDVQTQIAIANSMLQVKRAKLKRSKRRQICRELRILELAQRDAEMHQLSRRLCKQNIGPTNRTYGIFQEGSLENRHGRIL